MLRQMLVVLLMYGQFFPAYGKDSDPFADKIIAALKVNKSKHERAIDFHRIIAELKSHGYIGKKHDAKEDYAEQWVLRKPIFIFGNHVLVIGQETLGKFVGCCFENRTTIIMSALGEVENARRFAKDNECLLFYDEPRDQESSKETLSNLRVKANAEKLIEMTCADTEIK